FGEANRKAKPAAAPMAKVRAESRKGGVFPEASVKRASIAHMMTAENPMSVALAMALPPEMRAGNCTGRGLASIGDGEAGGDEANWPDLRANCRGDRRIQPGFPNRREGD